MLANVDFLNPSVSIVGFKPKHQGLNPSDVCVVARKPLSDVGRNGGSLNASESVDGLEPSKVIESINLGDMRVPYSSRRKVSVKNRRRRRKAAVRCEAEAPSPYDDSESLCSVTGVVESDITVETFPALNALIELDKMSVN